MENRASFHRHFLSTYYVPAPSTHDCTLERRAPGCGQRGGHSCGGVTPLWEQDAGLPRVGAVRTVLASGQGSAECDRESLRKEAWRGRWGDSRSTHLGKQTSGEEAEARQVLEAKENEEEALGGEKKEKHP